MSRTSARTRSSRSSVMITTSPCCARRSASLLMSSKPERERQPGARQHRPLLVEDGRLGQPAHRRLRGQRRRADTAGSSCRLEADAVEVAGHCHRIGADRLLVLADIGVGDRDRFRDRGAHLVAEPGFDAEAEEQVREHRDDDRRQHGDQAEQADQPDLQPRAGEAAPPLGPYRHQPLGDERRQRQQQHQIEVEQDQDRLAPGPNGGAPVSAR